MSSLHVMQIGPPLPLANDLSLQDLQKRLHSYIDCFTDAPFTFQRLCELLIEPHKQYTHLHKVVMLLAVVYSFVFFHNACWSGPEGPARCLLSRTQELTCLISHVLPDPGTDVHDYCFANLSAWVAFCQSLAYEKLLLVVRSQPVTSNPPPRPRIGDLGPVNENITVAHPIRTSDAHQRVPLEPLFHIDTEAQPAAQPMSIDSAPHPQVQDAQAQVVGSQGNGNAAEQVHAVPAGLAGQHVPGQHANALRAEGRSPTKVEDPGQQVIALLHEKPCTGLHVIMLRLCLLR